MPRRRLAVALLAPPSEAARIDVLRRALAVPEPFHVPPHVTLVPPTNVAEADLAQVRRLLRDAAAAARPLELDLGPVTSFAPDSPTIHLAVGGSAAGSRPGALAELRERLRHGPFDRPDRWPFVPHVTLAEGWPPASIDGVLATLAGARARWSVDAVHLLEQRTRGDGRRRWVPVAEEPLGGPTVVGRGGVELVLRPAGMVEEAVAALCGVPPEPPPVDGGLRRPVVLVAERPAEPGTPVGAAVGSRSGDVARLDAVVVAGGEHGAGTGRHLVLRWCAAVADMGISAVLAEPASDDARDFLVHHGFVDAAGLLIRRC